MSDISPSYEEIVAVIYTAICGETVQTWEVPLIVTQRSWAAPSTGSQTVWAGDVRRSGEADVVTLTSDGRGYIPGAWHDGPRSESVYVERWQRGLGRVFHGFIDSQSRRLVQSG